MRSLVFLLVISIAFNGLLTGFLAGHLSHGHDHEACCRHCDECDCDCEACDCRKPKPTPQPESRPEPSPSVDELKRMRGWVPA